MAGTEHYCSYKVLFPEDCRRSTKLIFTNYGNLLDWGQLRPNKAIDWQYIDVFVVRIAHLKSAHVKKII
jgi:hypothetical protein